MQSRIPVLILILVAASMLAAACGGGGDEGAYEDGLARVQSKLEQANEESRAASGVSDERERGAALQKAHESIEGAADTADELDPPSDVEGAHADLVEALREYAALFERLANTPEDDPGLTELYGEAGEIVEQLDAANREIADAGYEVADADADDT